MTVHCAACQAPLVRFKSDIYRRGTRVRPVCGTPCRLRLRTLFPERPHGGVQFKDEFRGGHRVRPCPDCDGEFRPISEFEVQRVGARGPIHRWTCRAHVADRRWAAAEAKRAARRTV